MKKIGHAVKTPAYLQRQGYPRLSFLVFLNDGDGDIAVAGTDIRHGRYNGQFVLWKIGTNRPLQFLQFFSPDQLNGINCGLGPTFRVDMPGFPRPETPDLLQKLGFKETGVGMWPSDEGLLHLPNQPDRYYAWCTIKSCEYDLSVHTNKCAVWIVCSDPLQFITFERTNINGLYVHFLDLYYSDIDYFVDRRIGGNTT